MWKKTEIKHRKGEGAKEVGIVKREYIAIEQGVRNKVKNDWWKFTSSYCSSLLESLEDRFPEGEILCAFSVSI